LQERENEYNQPIVPFVTWLELGNDVDPATRDSRFGDTPYLSPYCDRCGCDHTLPVEDLPVQP
jgi:hypothetical protein